MKTRTMYMHTVRGLPASYVEGEQICIRYAGRWDRTKGAKLVESVAQIKREQRASRRWRLKRGYDVTDDIKYGYVRVEVPV